MLSQTESGNEFEYINLQPRIVKILVDVNEYYKYIVLRKVGLKIYMSSSN